MSFRDVDLQRPLSVDDAVNGARDGAFVKGMFFDDARALLEQAGAPLAKNYVAFKDYSEREYNEVLIAAALAAYPGRTLRDQIRHVARYAFPTLRKTLIGRVIFGVLGDDLIRVYGLAPKGYAVSTSNVDVTILENVEGRVVADIRGASLPIEGFHVGVFEGACLACGSSPGAARVDLDNEFNGKLELLWNRAAPVEPVVWLPHHLEPNDT